MAGTYQHKNDKKMGLRTSICSLRFSDATHNPTALQTLTARNKIVTCSKKGSGTDRISLERLLNKTTNFSTTKSI